MAILERLDPATVVKELELLVEPDEPVLLCWERPPLTATNWCHRTMVAEWLEEKLGMSVPEITAVEEPAGSPVSFIGMLLVILISFPCRPA